MSASEYKHPPSLETRETSSGAGLSDSVEELVPTVTPEERFFSAITQLLEADHPHLLDWLTEQAVRRAYTHGHGSQVQAARLLGISRNAFRTLMKRAGLLSGEGRVGRVVEVAHRQLLPR